MKTQTKKVQRTAEENLRLAELELIYTLDDQKEADFRLAIQMRVDQLLTFQDDVCYDRSDWTMATRRYVAKWLLARPEAK